MENADTRKRIHDALADADAEQLRAVARCVLDLIANCRTASRASGYPKRNYAWTYRLELEILRKLNAPARARRPVLDQLEGA